MRVIAHVSDTHFGNDVQDPADRAAAVIEHLVSMSPRPDVLVFTGDLADHGVRIGGPTGVVDDDGKSIGGQTAGDGGTDAT